MKKIIKIIVPLVLIFVCVTGAFAQGTLSEEILNQAKREAGLFLELKSALGLDWLDEYNAYLENPTSNPEPSWDLSVADLVNGGYLSDSFPSDFTITKAGQEVKISKIITSQAMKDVLPIYLPSVTIAGDVVSLIVQRPEQWVAWQAGLLGKVSRDGSDNPDILPNAVLDFGKGSEIRFINDDGKLVGIDSLTYKGQELEDRFINTDGDNMSGDLYIKGNIAWHKGNDGSGSGLDADLLDGQQGSFYRDAGNLNAGVVPVARLSGTYNINISRNAATATKLATARTISLTGNASGSASFDGSGNISINTSVSYASNADTVDGKHASSFVQKSGDTMTGNLTLQGTSINIQRPETSGGYARGIMFYSKDGSTVSTVEAGIGMLGSGNNPPQTLYMGFGTSPWNSSAGLTVTPTNITFKDNKVWHAGNDGSGSGLDADLLDGKDSSFFTNASNLSSGLVPIARLSGTYNINISGNAATATKLATARTISLTGNASGSASFDGSSNISINTNVSYSSNSDKLDGYHADSFIKKSGDTATGPIYFKGGLSAEAQTKDDITTRTPSGFWQTNSATTGEGWPQTTNTWYHLLSSTHSNTGNYYAMQFAGNFFNSNDIYYRSTNGSGTTPWNKMWHSGNDGSGSGLDADLLDGKHWSDIKSYIDSNSGSIVAQSLGTNGYVKFSTGLIIQWGIGGTGSPTSVIFPLAFPNTCLTVAVTVRGSINKASTNNAYNIKKTGFSYNQLQASGIYWIAIGY